MTSLRSVVPLFAVLVGCASGANAPGAKPVYPPSEVAGSDAKCEKICGVEASATTIEAFCDALVQKTTPVLGATPTCKPQGPLGLPTRDEAAVRDAMVVDLVVPEARYSVLALRTPTGWELAAELAAFHGAAIEKEDALTVVGARPVDSPDLSPYGVEIRVRLNAQGDTQDKIFVCGKKGKQTGCPRAIVASS